MGSQSHSSGHQRVKAAEASGIEELPVVYVDLDDAAEKQLNIALNRITGGPSQYAQYAGSCSTQPEASADYCPSLDFR